MDQERAMKMLHKFGYEASIEDGILTVIIESEGAAAFQQESLRARFLLEKSGYRQKVAFKN